MRPPDRAAALTDEINRCRADPPAYAAELERRYRGCYSEGGVFTPPGGGAIGPTRQAAQLSKVNGASHWTRSIPQ